MLAIKFEVAKYYDFRLCTGVFCSFKLCARILKPPTEVPLRSILKYVSFLLNTNLESVSPLCKIFFLLMVK